MFKILRAKQLKKLTIILNHKYLKYVSVGQLFILMYIIYILVFILYYTRKEYPCDEYNRHDLLVSQERMKASPYPLSRRIGGASTPDRT